ncbi:hypothetical protein ATSB10_28320 [Dyella thiooxydans]|uniref:Uncharacterized protein n=1 Tax=Dyella thiooxydans TaxID=445710 RepID=A0A160N2W8_9GAMM|nr:hypothetical protein ATSB10_28320 [Dyella thiooxydans]
MCRAVLCRLLVVAMLVAPALHASPTRRAKPPATKVSSQAALDAFHQARHCLELGLNIESLSNVRQICNRDGVSDRCSASRQAWRAHRIEQFQRAQSGCSADPKVQEADFRATLIAAVATGDPDVEDCYVEGWSNATSADIPMYVRTSEQLIAKGLARGDWRIVAVLANPIEPEGLAGAGMAINLPQLGSWMTDYRFNRLLWLGARGQYADMENFEVEAAARWLRPAARRRADAWAQAEFRRHFSHSPVLDQAPRGCLHVEPAD